MSNQLEQAATRAIFQLQLNTRQAVRYVSKQARVSDADAEKALTSVMLSYKTSK